MAGFLRKKLTLDSKPRQVEPAIQPDNDNGPPATTPLYAKFTKPHSGSQKVSGNVSGPMGLGYGPPGQGVGGGQQEAQQQLQQMHGRTDVQTKRPRPASQINKPLPGSPFAATPPSDLYRQPSNGLKPQLSREKSLPQPILTPGSDNPPTPPPNPNRRSRQVEYFSQADYQNAASASGSSSGPSQTRSPPTFIPTGSAPRVSQRKHSVDQGGPPPTRKKSAPGVGRSTSVQHRGGQENGNGRVQAPRISPSNTSTSTATSTNMRPSPHSYQHEFIPPPDFNPAMLAMENLFQNHEPAFPVRTASRGAGQEPQTPPRGMMSPSQPQNPHSPPRGMRSPPPNQQQQYPQTPPRGMMSPPPHHMQQPPQMQQYPQMQQQQQQPYPQTPPRNHTSPPPPQQIQQQYSQVPPPRGMMSPPPQQQQQQQQMQQQSYQQSPPRSFTSPPPQQQQQYSPPPPTNLARKPSQMVRGKPLIFAAMEDTPDEPPPQPQFSQPPPPRAPENDAFVSSFGAVIAPITGDSPYPGALRPLKIPVPPENPRDTAHLLRKASKAKNQSTTAPPPVATGGGMAGLMRARSQQQPTSSSKQQQNGKGHVPNQHSLGGLHRMLTKSRPVSPATSRKSGSSGQPHQQQQYPSQYPQQVEVYDKPLADRDGILPVDDDPFAPPGGVKIKSPLWDEFAEPLKSPNSVYSVDTASPPFSPYDGSPVTPVEASAGKMDRGKAKANVLVQESVYGEIPDWMQDSEPDAFPLVRFLSEPGLLSNLLSFFSFFDWCLLGSISKEIRRQIDDTKDLREEALERFLNPVGYSRWAWTGPEPPGLTLKDLGDYMRGVSTPTHEYARKAYAYLKSFHAPDESTDSTLPDTVISLAASTRAYTKVVLRLRAQAEMEQASKHSGFNGPAPSSAKSTPSRAALSRSSSRAADSGTSTPQPEAFKSPLFRIKRAPLLRVFVPSPDGDWLSDASVLQCEEELHRAGVVGMLRIGDVVWDVAVGDEGNIGRLVWDGSYLIDLDYTYSVVGDLPKYLHTFYFPPSYFHRVIRTGNGNSNPVGHIDISPWGDEIAGNLQLIQDRVRTETPQGAYHNVVRWVHRSSFIIRPPRGNPRSNPNLIPGTDGLSVDPGWYGTVVVEAEGTNEGLADLQDRCGPGVFPPRAGAGYAGDPKALEAKKVFRILREKSRPGEIWIRTVREKERLL